MQLNMLSILKRVILEARLELANRLEEARARVSDPETIRQLMQQLEPYDEFMKEEWFRITKAARLPQLIDRHLGADARFSSRACPSQTQQQLVGDFGTLGVI